MAKKKKESNKPISSKKAKKKIIKKRTVKKGPSEWSERKPVVLFAASFLVICIVFYLITNMAWFQSLRAPILLGYSNVSSAILNIYGFRVKSNG